MSCRPFFSLSYVEVFELCWLYYQLGVSFNIGQYCMRMFDNLVETYLNEILRAYHNVMLQCFQRSAQWRVADLTVKDYERKVLSQARLIYNPSRSPSLFSHAGIPFCWVENCCQRFRCSSSIWIDQLTQPPRDFPWISQCWHHMRGTIVQDSWRHTDFPLLSFSCSQKLCSRYEWRIHYHTNVIVQSSST